MHPNNEMKRDVLSRLGEFIVDQTRRHESKQRLWYPSEILPRTHEAPPLPPEVIAVLVLNLLTEEGLPHFHRLLATNLGEDEHMVNWTDLWTAEEDRHGEVLMRYLLRVPSVDMAEIDRMKYKYIRRGFRPDWEGDAYLLLAYTVLQERATQVSHANLGKIVEKIDPVLADILRKIAAEEAKHFAFYRNVFGKILEADPNNALVALKKVIRNFAMPGKMIPGFEDLSLLASRTGVFGPEEFSDIVEEVTRYYDVSGYRGLDESGKEAQKRISSSPAALLRAAEAAAAKAKLTVSLPFLSTKKRWRSAEV